MTKRRYETEPQCYLEVSKVQGEHVMFLTVPEDTPQGDRVAIWISPKSAQRLIKELMV